MKVFSKTHVLTIVASALVFAPKDAAGKPLPKTNIVQAPAGTVVEMTDAEAQPLIAEGLVVEYKEDEHKAVDGVVPVTQFQRIAPVAPLPEGMTQPSVVRQDETLNDGRTTGGVANGMTVVGDTRENAARAAEQEAAAKALVATGGKSPEQVAAERAAAEKAGK